MLERPAKATVMTLSICLIVAVLLLHWSVPSFHSFTYFPAMADKLATDLTTKGVNFTSLVLATDTQSLNELLLFHCSLPCLQKIVVVWNNLESTVHTDYSDVNCAANVTLIQQRDNSINNQLKPFHEIETDGQFMLFL